MQSRFIVQAVAVAAIGAAVVGCQADTTTPTKASAVSTVPAQQKSDPAAPTTTAAPRVAVPAVVGQRLEQAESTLTAAGFSNVNPEDATGQDRAVLNPANWIVTGQTPASGQPADASTSVRLKVQKPSDAADSTSAQVASGRVPNVVCMDLQRAQDTLQAAGFYNLGSQDGTGQGRMQLVDRNWVVTAESPAAGSKPDTATRIVLTAVKFGEPTGSSGCKS